MDRTDENMALARRFHAALATILRIEDAKIASIETFLSDVPGMNAFFAVLN